MGSGAKHANVKWGMPVWQSSSKVVQVVQDKKTADTTLGNKPTGSKSLTADCEEKSYQCTIVPQATVTL